MRHVIRGRKKLYYASPEWQKAENSGERIEKFRSAAEFYASVVPESGRMAAEVYGERLPYVKRLYGATAHLAEGDGIWLNAALTEQPDYRVIALEEHPQETIILIGKRGVFGG